MRGSLKLKIDLPGLEIIKRKSPEVFRKALEKGAIQWLTWANNGSVNSSLKPPIRRGVLRGSSSAFVGGKLVSVFKQPVAGGGMPTPAQSYTGKAFTVTWVWNTDYAIKMHEWNGDWGEYTEQDGDAGAKWAEEHLEKDREDFFKVVAIEAKKGLKT